MTRERDLERLLDSWLADGPTIVADRVIDDAAARITRQPQRPAWRLRPWRFTHMSSSLKAALVAAAVLAALAGTLLVTGGGGPGPAPTASPSAGQAASPGASSSTGPTALFRETASLAPGTYVVGVDAATVTFTVPDGWSVPSMGNLDFILNPTSGPADDVVRIFFDAHRAAKDAACTEAPEPSVGTTAAALIADLQADRDLLTSTPKPITVGGLSGQYIDVVIGASTQRTCPFASGAPTVPLIVDDIAGEGPFWGIGVAERERLVILDRGDGRNVVIVIDSILGSSFNELAAAAMPVIETFRIR